MAYITQTPAMLLNVPTVGVAPGPEFASILNGDLSILDQHDHSPGYGVPVSQAGILLTGNLSYSGYSATNILSVILNSQATAPATVGTIYENGNDLHYINGAGLDIQMTNASGIVGSPGSISGISGTASVNYISPTYFFYSATLTPANIAVASISLANVAASSPTITISPPNPLSASYALTLPSALPASQAILEMSSTGVITAVPTDFQSLTPSGGVIMYAGTSIPTGWLLCNGQAVSRSVYATLFGAIGTTFGSGDGSTTFNVPNTGGVFVRSAGSQTIGGVGYSSTLGVSQSDSFQNHTHAIPVPIGSAYIEGLIGAALGFGTEGVSSTGTVATSTGNSNSGRSDTETRPANISLNYIIKT